MNDRSRLDYGRVARIGVLLSAIVGALFPFWWMFVTSLKRPVDIFDGMHLWPQHLTFSNYTRLLGPDHMGSFLFNSLVVVAGSVTLSMTLGTLAACAIARFRLPFGLNERALVASLLVRMVPAVILIIPLYITLGKLHLLDTRLGLLLIETGLNTSFVIWMVQSFLAEIPRDIQEAALVDGDSQLSAIRRVVLPLAAPGLAATAIFSVINVYNDFVIPLTVTSTPKSQTVTVGISTFIGKIQTEWGPLAAAATIGTLPIMIFALLVQRHFVRGLTMGAVK